MAIKQKLEIVRQEIRLMTDKALTEISNVVDTCFIAEFSPVSPPPLAVPGTFSKDPSK
jgi:hypothetical protein